MNTKYEILPLPVAAKTKTYTERLTTAEILANDTLLSHEALSNWHWPDAGQEHGLWGRIYPIKL